MYSTYCYETEEKNARISFLENQLIISENKNVEYLSEICNLNGKLSAFEGFFLKNKNLFLNLKNLIILSK